MEAEDTEQDEHQACQGGEEGEHDGGSYVGTECVHDVADFDPQQVGVPFLGNHAQCSGGAVAGEEENGHD